MRWLPTALVLVLAAAAAVAAPACTERACFQWSADEGQCPAADEAAQFFGDCTNISKVRSQPTHVADEGLCCYDVAKTSDSFPLCDEETPEPPQPVMPEPTDLSSGDSSSTTFDTSTGVSTSSFSTGSFSGAGGSGGLGGMGGSGGGIGGFGGGMSCLTCSEAYLQGTSGILCPGGSQAAYDALVACACSTLCLVDCSSICNTGGAADGVCQACVDTHCGPEETDCTTH